MNINWVLANQVVVDPLYNIDEMKSIGSFWGGWQTWRSCQTDNVICHDLQKAQDLVKRNFHTLCNLHVPSSSFVALDRPDRVRLYEGEFKHEVYNKEELVAMHLAATTSDIILLLGFNWETPKDTGDRLQNHYDHNYFGLTKEVIKNHPLVQWVLVDHIADVTVDFKTLPNLTRESLTGVLSLLKS
jgi:hypothetical protein